MSSNRRATRTTAPCGIDCPLVTPERRMRYRVATRDDARPTMWRPESRRHPSRFGTASASWHGHVVRCTSKKATVRRRASPRQTARGSRPGDRFPRTANSSGVCPGTVVVVDEPVPGVHVTLHVMFHPDRGQDASSSTRPRPAALDPCRRSVQISGRHGRRSWFHVVLRCVAVITARRAESRSGASVNARPPPSLVTLAHQTVDVIAQSPGSSHRVMNDDTWPRTRPSQSAHIDSERTPSRHDRRFADCYSIGDRVRLVVSFGSRSAPTVKFATRGPGRAP